MRETELECTPRRGLRYCLDALLAMIGLVLAAPLLVVAAGGILLSSPGPILHRARRVGYRGREFTLYKLRTMRLNIDGDDAPITAHKDPRVFPFGAWLRSTKIDELPQLFNVFVGDMAIVGPRPEAPELVRRYYTPLDWETLNVLPGLTSPGSLDYYAHCESALVGDDAVRVYGERLLPAKLALDRIYIADATLHSDLRIILRTLAVIAGRLFWPMRPSRDLNRPQRPSPEPASNTKRSADSGEGGASEVPARDYGKRDEGIPPSLAARPNSPQSVHRSAAPAVRRQQTHELRCRVRESD
jgi:lipopolysaccharide/colanic/teichoic acid biosynthesis glycosyltransferase